MDVIGSTEWAAEDKCRGPAFAIGDRVYVTKGSYRDDGRTGIVRKVMQQMALVELPGLGEKRLSQSSLKLCISSSTQSMSSVVEFSGSFCETKPSSVLEQKIEQSLEENSTSRVLSIGERVYIQKGKFQGRYAIILKVTAQKAYVDIEGDGERCLMQSSLTPAKFGFKQSANVS